MSARRPLRILMTTDSVGGVWQYACDLSAGLAAAGNEVLLALLGPAADAVQHAEAAALPGVRLIETGLPLDWLSDREEPVREAARTIGALARHEKVDLVHLNSPALAADCDAGAPLVAAAHGCVATWWDAVRGTPLAPEFHWHRERMARGLRAADAVIAPSASHAEAVRDQYGLHTSPRVIHNGRNFALADTHVPTSGDFALTVGRLWDEAKNARLLDAAAARLPFPFRAAGSTRGPHGEQVELHALDLLGHCDAAAIAQLLAARPAFVSAAYFEPFGLAVLEAAAAGCPLILSDIPTFRELWEDAAIFVAPDDVAGFAEAIERCVTDAAERKRRGAAAKARAQRYSVAAMTQATAALYTEVAARKAAA